MNSILRSITEIPWWYPLAVMVGMALLPIVRALAVVMIGRWVASDLAKLAIPLVLKPVRPSLFPMRKPPDALTAKRPPEIQGPRREAS